MKRINAIIIDDETSAINTLTGMLSEYCPEVNIVATSSTEEEAILAISKHNPELVLLNIDPSRHGTAQPPVQPG